THGAMVRGMAVGKLTAAPPKQPAGDLATDAEAIAGLPPAPPPLPVILRYRLLLFLVVLLALIIVGALSGSVGLSFLLIVIAVVAFIIAELIARARGGAGWSPASIVDPGEVADAVEQAPPRPAFAFIETDHVAPVEATGETHVTNVVELTSDSAN